MARSKELKLKKLPKLNHRSTLNESAEVNENSDIIKTVLYLILFF